MTFECTSKDQVKLCDVFKSSSLWIKIKINRKLIGGNGEAFSLVRKSFQNCDDKGTTSVFFWIKRYRFSSNSQIALRRITARTTQHTLAQLQTHDILRFDSCTCIYLNSILQQIQNRQSSEKWLRRNISIDVERSQGEATAKWKSHYVLHGFRKARKTIAVSHALQSTVYTTFTLHLNQTRMRWFCVRFSL